MITILLQKILDVIKAYITSLNTKLTQIKDNLSELIVVKTATGSIANFTTSLALPLVSAKFAIKATGGNGTSSPIALNGFTGLNVYQRGGNLWDEEWEVGGLIWATGEEDNLSPSRIRSKNYIPVKPNVVLYLKSDYTTGICFYDENKTFISSLTGYTNRTVTIPTNTYYMRFSPNTQSPLYSNDISINYPSTDTNYNAYNSNSDVYHISWQTEAGTVYGGEIDVLNGKLKPCKYYASYNDETIVGPYLSSTSDLSAGAEVVDFGSFDEEVDIDTTSITALVGVNNIWGDTNGNAEIEYLGKFQEEPEDVSEVIQVNTITVNEVI